MPRGEESRCQSARQTQMPMTSHLPFQRILQRGEQRVSPRSKALKFKIRQGQHRVTSFLLSPVKKSLTALASYHGRSFPPRGNRSKISHILFFLVVLASVDTIWGPRGRRNGTESS